jgi:cytochrome c-type biogenesis protein CcmH
VIGFWVLAALLTAAVVLLLARPLMRRTAPDDPAGSDLAVYRDQLAELERDRARGLLEPAEAASLETEIGRRMLAAARSVEPANAELGPARSGTARWLTAVLAIVVPAGAIVIYLAVGHPDLPGQPLAQRQLGPDSDPVKILAAVEDVRSKLKPVKEDLSRWVMVGEAYAKLGRPREAVDALRVAADLAPDDPGLSAALAEALMDADGGAVGEEARKRFQAIPDDSPAKPEARYYLALGDAQAGDQKAALKGWQSLLADSPADAPWVDQTRARIAQAATSLGLDPVKETPAPKPPEAPAASGNPEADAIARMTPEQQQQMIQGMVGKLAARLAANPDDPVGWRQLARAYQVLGEDDKARDALSHAEAAEKAPAKP